MVFISELFPNPAGTDTGNEWIELCNSGLQTQALAGWRLEDASKKTFTIGDVSVAPQSCVIFENAETKISLNNDKETISLFDAHDTLVDRISYNKAIKDNQALARLAPTGELQITTNPTKGKIENVITGIATRSSRKAMDGTAKIPSSPLSKVLEDAAISTIAADVGTSTKVSEQKMLISGTSLWEPVFVGVCVAGILTVVFVKIALQLKQKIKD